MDIDLRLPLTEQLRGGHHRLLHQGAQVDLGVVPLGMARLDLGHVQHLVHQPRQTLGLADDDGDELAALGRVHAGVVAHQLGQRPDRGERRAQLVRDRRHEVVLEPVQALELFIGRAQLAGGALQ